MNATAASARTIRVDTVTLHQSVIAQIFAEWAERLHTGHSVNPFLLMAAKQDPTGDRAAEAFIRLACEHAVDGFKGRHIPRPRPAQVTRPTAPKVAPRAVSGPAIIGPDGAILNRAERRLLERLDRLGAGQTLVGLCAPSDMDAAARLIGLGLAQRPDDDDGLELTTRGRAMLESVG